jgi:hypothetical protein
MRNYVILLLGALFWGNQVNAQEHEACVDLNYDYQSQTAKQLRAIAATCQSDRISHLYYNRAYHVDLLKEGETMSHIDALYSRGLIHYIESYRIYIALIEAFAPNWYPDVEARAAFLNQEYDHRGEVAELRLHGYDRLADVKEKQISFP